MKTIKILLVMLAFTLSGNSYAKSHFIIDMVKFKNKNTSISNYLEAILTKYL